jgi:CHASE1-domain containing sensor protein
MNLGLKRLVPAVVALAIALSVTLAVPSLAQSNSQQAKRAQQSNSQQPTPATRNDGYYRGYPLRDWYRPDRY